MKIEKLLFQTKLNVNQEHVNEYSPKVQELIHMNLVDTISNKEIDRVKGFFNNGLDYCNNKMLCKKK